jgi:hypothetical protein
VINQLKLRASYGSIGNLPTSYYGYMSVYSISSTAMYAGIPGVFPSRLGNPDLTWEKCFETNVALEARLFDRFDLEVEWYDKNTSGLLYNVSLSALTGFGSQWQNVGAVRNRGVEVTFSPDIIKTKDFKWNLAFVLGYNQSEVEELYGGTDQVYGYETHAEQVRSVGQPMNTWYLREWAGVDRYTGQPMWYKYNEDGSRELTFNFNDATRTYLESANPDFTGGIITTATWKGLSLSAGFNFVSGNKIYNYNRYLYDSDGKYTDRNAMQLEPYGWTRWEKPGDVATHPQAIVGGNHLSSEPSSRYLEDGSYFRMANLSLSYALPDRWLKPLGIKGVTLSVSGENLFTITKFSGIDPDVGAGVDATGLASYDENQALYGTAGSGLYPIPRRFSFGLNLSF